MKTLQKQTSINGGEQLTFLQEASPANLTPQQAKERAKKMIDISGQKCLEQFKRLNPHSLWEKMFLESLVGIGDWFSMRCKLSWKLKGTRFNQYYFQLVPSMHPTEEIESGLLPTPKAREAPDCKSERERHTPSMESMAAMGLLPTPTTFYTRENWSLEDIEEKREEVKNATNQKGKHYTGNGFGLNLAQAVKLLPTPTTRDWKGTGKNERVRNGKIQKDTLDRVFEPGTDSQLNPQFVAEMMGFPSNWTELPFQSGDKNLSSLWKCHSASGGFANFQGLSSSR